MRVRVILAGCRTLLWYKMSDSSVDWKNLGGMNVNDLRDACSKLGLNVDGKATKKNLVKMLENYHKKEHPYSPILASVPSPQSPSAGSPTNPTAVYQVATKSNDKTAGQVHSPRAMSPSIKERSPLSRTKASKPKPLNVKKFTFVVVLMCLSLATSIYLYFH